MDFRLLWNCITGPRVYAIFSGNPPIYNSNTWESLGDIMFTFMSGFRHTCTVLSPLLIGVRSCLWFSLFFTFLAYFFKVFWNLIKGKKRLYKLVSMFSLSLDLSFNPCGVLGFSSGESWMWLKSFVSLDCFRLGREFSIPFGIWSWLGLGMGFFLAVLQPWCLISLWWRPVVSLFLHLLVLLLLVSSNPVTVEERIG